MTMDKTKLETAVEKLKQDEPNYLLNKYDQSWCIGHQKGWNAAIDAALALISVRQDAGGETQGGDRSVMRLLVRHIIQHKDRKFYGDHACKQCHPHSDMLISGFKCGLHKAIEIDAQINTPGTPIEARKSQALGWASKAGATSPEEAEAIYKSYQKLKVDDEAARLRRATPSQGNSSLDAFWIVEQWANCVSDKPPREELRVIEIALQSTGGNKGDA